MDPRHPPKLPFSPSPYAIVSPFPQVPVPVPVPVPNPNSAPFPASPTTTKQPSSTPNGAITIPSAGSAPATATAAVFYPIASPPPHSYRIARAESYHHPHAENLSPDQNPAYAAPHSLAQRRPSDTSIYAPTIRHKSHESNHARFRNSAAINSLGTLNREMPPPTSPPQPGAKPPQPQPQQVHSMMGYGPPPPQPGPPVAVGPPMSFPSGRELPALGALARSGSSNSSMSISSMLGGPPPAMRESQPPPSHYPPHSGPPVSGPGFATAMHASPRMHSANSSYPPFRRPHTPDHQRPYEPRNSPPGHYPTPEALQIMQENLAGYHQGLPQGRAASLSIRECLDRWRWDDRQGQKKHMGDVMRWADLRLAWNTTLKELVCDLIRTRIGTGQNASEWVK
ncbi:uncharacterized protein LW94_3149 [Fusarium fujikuroi]|nr:uncharacterized protein LW94_3149 [Fusarium fujikuroi]